MRERERERERETGKNKYTKVCLYQKLEIEVSAHKIYHAFRHPLKVIGLSWCLNTDNSRTPRHRMMVHLWQQGIVYKYKYL